MKKHKIILVLVIITISTSYIYTKSDIDPLLPNLTPKNQIIKNNNDNHRNEPNTLYEWPNKLEIRPNQTKILDLVTNTLDRDPKLIKYKIQWVNETFSEQKYNPTKIQMNITNTTIQNPKPHKTYHTKVKIKTNNPKKKKYHIKIKATLGNIHNTTGWIKIPIKNN